MKILRQFNFLFVIIVLLLVNCTRSKINNETDYDQLYAIWHDDDYKDSLATTLKPVVQKALRLTNSAANRVSIDSVLSVLRWTNDSVSFKQLSNKAVKFATSSSDKQMLAKAFNDIGMYYHDLNQLDSTFYYYLKVENIYKSLADSAKIAEINFYQARLLFEKGLFMESEVKTAQCLHLLRNNTQDPVLFEANQLMSLCLNMRGDFTLAKVYLNKTLDLILEDIGKYRVLDKSRLYTTINTVYINLSEVSYSLKEYKESSDYATEAMKYGDVFSPEILKIFSKVSKEKADFKLMLQANKKLNVETHLQSLFTGMQLAESIKNHHLLIQFYMVAAELYFEVGETVKSFEYAEKAYQVALDRDFKPWQRDALEFLVTHKKYENNNLVKSLITLNRTIAQQDHITRNRFARIAYETEQVEIENTSLRNLIYIVVIVSMFIIITLLIGVYVIRLRGKNKEILFIKDQQIANDSIYQLILERSEIAVDAKNSVRNKIAKDIHDGVVNGIFTIRFNLQQLYTDNEALKETLISELQILEKSTRDISHSLIDNELFGQKKFISLIEELLSLQKNQWNTEFILKYTDDLDLDALTAIDKVNTYFIIREAVQNVNKYSEATSCEISFTLKEEGAIVVKIKDNGIGFEESSGKGGIGLQNMRERACELRSELLVYSQKNLGTVLTFRIYKLKV